MRKSEPRLCMAFSMIELKSGVFVLSSGQVRPLACAGKSASSVMDVAGRVIERPDWLAAAPERHVAMEGLHSLSGNVLRLSLVNKPHLYLNWLDFLDLQRGGFEFRGGFISVDIFDLADEVFARMEALAPKVPLGDRI